MIDWSTPKGWLPLIDWYQQQESYPWSNQNDPYVIWVSETMLQQTTAATVKQRFLRWFEDFPTVEELARATEAQVLKAWEGLGYYQRARNLYQASKIIAQEGWPQTPTEWQRLPGVGPYAARAISSFYNDYPVAAFDTNLKRILCRLECQSDWNKEVQARWEDRFTRLFSSSLPSGQLNAALMRLGQVLCWVKNPRCATCPLKPLCLAYHQGRQNEVPQPLAKPTLIRETLYPMFLMRGHPPALFLVKSKTRRFNNQYLPPFGAMGWWENPNFERIEFVGSFSHSVTNHRYTLVSWVAWVSESPPELGEGQWFNAQGLEQTPMPSVYRRIIKRFMELG